MKIDKETGEITEDDEINILEDETSLTEEESDDLSSQLKLSKEEIDKSLASLREEEPQNNPALSSDYLTAGLTEDQIIEFYEYTQGRAKRPEFAEKFFADADSRIKESNQITTMLSLTFIPKLLGIAQSLITNISKPNALMYKSIDEQISLFSHICDIISKVNFGAMNYSKLARDYSMMPSVYRQLVDILLQIPPEKLDRMKYLTKLSNISDDTWLRVKEIVDMES